MKNALLQTLHKKIVQAGAILDNYHVKSVTAYDNTIRVTLEAGTVVSQHHKEQLNKLSIFTFDADNCWEMDLHLCL